MLNADKNVENINKNLILDANNVHLLTDENQLNVFWLSENFSYYFIPLIRFEHREP